MGLSLQGWACEESTDSENSSCTVIQNSKTKLEATLCSKIKDQLNKL